MWKSSSLHRSIGPGKHQCKQSTTKSPSTLPPGGCPYRLGCPSGRRSIASVMSSSSSSAPFVLAAAFVSLSASTYIQIRSSHNPTENFSR
jgi:hypothetical protein